MAEVITERISRYVLDGDDDDLRRLLRIAQVTSQEARTAFDRVGIREGWRAIDCGCGPIGALAEMADMVGPSGRAVGVDFNEPALERARAVVEALGLENVELVAGDIYQIDPTSLGDRFDLAFTRCFLMHQPDPVRALGQITTFVRPGGWVVAHEPLPTPPPRSYPHLAALASYWEIVHETMELGGASPQAVESLARSAPVVGLDVVRTGGFFTTLAPRLGFDLHAATLAAVRERAIKMGIPPTRIDNVAQDLRAAREGGYEWVSTPFFLGLEFRKP